MVVTDIRDLQRLAWKRLPSIFYTYVANGGYEEETLRHNRQDFEALRLVPRVLDDVSKRSTETDLIGTPSAMPVALAPVGACGIVWPNGEMEAVRAANEADVPFCLSTLSICTIEDVAEAARKPFWFQLYMMKDKGVTQALVDRAKAARCSTLVLSMDLHVRSQRHGEQKHGLGAPPRFDLPNVWDGLTHPRWLFSMIGSRRRTFGNLIGLVKDAENLAKITAWLEEQFDPTLSTKDIDWARKVWPGKVVVKGILHPDEARACFDHGADGIVVSNHGGRQVDGAVSSISMLPHIVDAVRGRGAVLMDGGVRSGMDVLKALALGADGCLIGRAYMYGLAAMGRKGVAKALDIIHTELDQHLALCGLTDVHELPNDLIYDPEPLRSRVTLR